MGRSLRVEQFSVDDICVVHAIQRCVRRAFLAGKDEKTGKDYSFRKEWIRRRMEALASVFGIDVLTYAVMSNHIHLILRNRPDVVSQWTRIEKGATHQLTRLVDLLDYLPCLFFWRQTHGTVASSRTVFG